MWQLYLLVIQNVAHIVFTNVKANCIYCFVWTLRRLYLVSKWLLWTILKLYGRVGPPSSLHILFRKPVRIVFTLDCNNGGEGLRIMQLQDIFFLFFVLRQWDGVSTQWMLSLKLYSVTWLSCLNIYLLTPHILLCVCYVYTRQA